VPIPAPGSGYVPQAKLSPPRAAAAQVARLAVAARWPEALRARVVLVRAPAGFGKTTAMRQMRERLQAEGQATAWLTLDAADNDVSRFLQCLGAAVRGLGGMAEREADGPGELSRALQSLAGEGRSFALFIDDFEVLHNDAVLGLVRQLMEQLPVHGRLVIGSRALPALGLGGCAPAASCSRSMRRCCAFQRPRPRSSFACAAARCRARPWRAWWTRPKAG
jgi:LuxR family maltose regulon positive regulatory protein